MGRSSNPRSGSGFEIAAVRRVPGKGKLSQFIQSRFGERVPNCSLGYTNGSISSVSGAEATDSAKESEHMLFFQSPRSAEEELRGKRIVADTFMQVGEHTSRGAVMSSCSSCLCVSRELVVSRGVVMSSCWCIFLLFLLTRELVVARWAVHSMMEELLDRNDREGCLAKELKEEVLCRTKLIFIPIICGVHWNLAVFDLGNKKKRVIDSLETSITKHEAEKALSKMEEYLRKFGISEFRPVNRGVKQQGNGNDCGFHMFMFIKELAKEGDLDTPLESDDKTIVEFRKELVWFLLKQPNNKPYIEDVMWGRQYSRRPRTRGAARAAPNLICV
ncbi:hypothetical protein E2562_037894 [Oryza meyeriana var. granulata]|uniref:Ubiquitin-like protease family profile domain-containing protein n=1 Tax=Oryza meyeriana var. granulata TaxID=110450 RepID=A0A6G1E894_9ORYZ|nr:hypothetical protein E2562_037894 [Oryza meyeriana var. granulata]